MGVCGGVGGGLIGGKAVSVLSADPIDYSNIKNTPVNNLFINYDGAQEAVESKPKTGPVIKCDTFKAELNSLEELEVHKATSCLSFFCVDCKKAFAEESQLFSHNKMMHAARTKGPEAMNMVKPGKQSAKGSSRPPTKRDRRPTPDLAKLKEALADLDEAARLQDGSRLQRSYSALAASFDAYSDVIPAEAFS